MIKFLHGKIFEQTKDSIIVEVNGIGYQVFVSHPSLFSIGSIAFIRTYEISKEDDHFLVGFISKEEMFMFMSLLKVNGIGPKTAISILSQSSPKEIENAINDRNINYLSNLQGVGYKTAYQILLDLKGNISFSKNENEEKIKQVTNALIAIGFKNAQIKKAINQINDLSMTKEELFKAALNKINK